MNFLSRFKNIIFVIHTFLNQMREIRMVDLKAQYEKIGAEIDMAVKSVLLSTAFIKGPDVKLFEEEMQAYMGVRNVVSCANGSDALRIAMMVLGLSPGDEVITTDFSFVAAAEAAALVGLKIVFVDPEPGTFNIPVDAIRKAITRRTRLIVPVHLFGQCADMESIMDLAARHNLFVIEDAAQATGADYYYRNGTSKKAGTIGHIGITSFFPSKNLGCCGDGGALYTNDDEYAGKLRSIANHGMKVRYSYSEIGVNSRLDTIQAAILRVKLRYLSRFNEARQKVAELYDEAFSGCNSIITPERASYSSHIFHQYTIRIKNGRRDALKSSLESKKIPSMIYYPGPLHMQDAFIHLGYKEDDFPVTRSLCNEVLSLPMHPEMDQEQLDYIVLNILNFFDNQQ
jgi:UDP-2-acetamido-2-deoxy-ribo-hexuluronate aminotransferase